MTFKDTLPPGGKVQLAECFKGVRFFIPPPMSVLVPASSPPLSPDKTAFSRPVSVVALPLSLRLPRRASLISLRVIHSERWRGKRGNDGIYLRV